ncbi:MAG TPA: hypothetical protein VK400_15265, partial [Pyrinomonadaceae bacterium]|nr:hypothetical protein [Pyrinomonadaceae bacterium]
EIEKILNKADSASAPPVRDFLKTIRTRFVEAAELVAERESEFLFFNVNRPSDFESISDKTGN